jgi:thioredoxin 1
MSSVASVSNATFQQEVLESNAIVLVDFWAPWCGPCRMVAPVVDAIAAQYKDRVKVVKLNVDDHPEIASRYGIRSIPALMLFKDGEQVDIVIGAVPKTTLADAIDKHL